jgi:hypothetical protein
METEVIAVPTRGVERWLMQRLSAVLGASRGRGDGVCANVEFPFPGRLVNGAVATAARVDRVQPLTEEPALPLDRVWPPWFSGSRAPRVHGDRDALRRRQRPQPVSFRAQEAASTLVARIQIARSQPTRRRLAVGIQ